MSGDRAAFVGDAMFRIVEAAGAVMRILGEPPVIVGGLAVMCRLQVAHRATLDLDVVDRGLRAEAHLEVLRRVDGAQAEEPAAVNIPTSAGMVKVDVLEVNQAELDRPSDDPGDRLHASAHAWAHETATSVSIDARSSQGERIDVVTLVAEPGPLVAMKLQAVMNRGDSKAGTDLLDIVRLVLDPGSRAAVVAQLHAQPESVRGDVQTHIEHWFATRRSWSFDRIRSVRGDVDREDLGLVHDVLVDAVAR